MTATEELRKMLDERGVRWDYGPSGASSTAFWVNGKELSFSNCRDGLVCSTIFTPAQAISATLGAGTCKNVAEPPSDGTFWPAPHFECSECGHKHVSMSYVYFCPNCGAKVVDE